MKLVISGNTPSQKNRKTIYINRKTNRPFIASIPAVKEWHKKAYFELTSKTIEQELIKGPVTVEVSFWRDTRRKYDLDNAYASVADALVNAKVLLDDNMEVVNRVILKHGGVDKLNPRAEIEIYENY